MQANEAMNKAKKDLEVKTHAFEELEKTNKKLQEDLKTAQKQDAEQKEKIRVMDEELKKIKEERDKLDKTSEERKQTIDKMETDVKDASSALLKLEEARIVLNRLIGPGGSMTQQERDKYLKNAVGAELPEA